MFFAGMETTSFALAHICASLTFDSEKQKTLRQVIQKTESENYQTAKIDEVDVFVKNKLAEIPHLKS